MSERRLLVGGSRNGQTSAEGNSKTMRFAEAPAKIYDHELPGQRFMKEKYIYTLLNPSQLIVPSIVAVRSYKMGDVIYRHESFSGPDSSALMTELDGVLWDIMAFETRLNQSLTQGTTPKCLTAYAEIRKLTPRFYVDQGLNSLIIAFDEIYKIPRIQFLTDLFHLEKALQ